MKRETSNGGEGYDWSEWPLAVLRKMGRDEFMTTPVGPKPCLYQMIMSLHGGRV